MPDDDDVHGEPDAVIGAHRSREVRTPRHPQVALAVGEWRADVDERLAPLIEALWTLGIRTIYSCQSAFLKMNLMRERREMFYVMFPDTEDLRRMLSLFVDTPYDPRRLQTTWHFGLFTRFEPPGTEPGDPVVGLQPIVYLACEHLDAVTTIARLHAGLAPDS